VTPDLSRLLRPKSIAVFGGGWAANVVEQLLKAGFGGDIWPVHPKRSDVHGVTAYPSLDALPAVPDAAWIGVNRDATIDLVRELRELGAGGAVCFASGFGETEDGADRNAALLEAAEYMPIVGPNCYGVLNYLDGATLWPDQHGGARVESGVAILTQSSNIAINLSMQGRGLPIAYMLTAGMLVRGRNVFRLLRSKSAHRNRRKSQLSLIRHRSLDRMRGAERFSNVLEFLYYPVFQVSLKR